MNITEETTSYGSRRPFKVLGKVFLEEGVVGGGVVAPPTCPPIGAFTSMTVKCILSGTLVSAFECGATAVDLIGDVEAPCPDVTTLWTLDGTDCLVDCGGTQDVTWICPDPCDSDSERTAGFGCTVIYHMSTGHWELSPYFVLTPPAFCGINDPTMADLAFHVDIGTGSPIGLHVLDMDDPGNPTVHVQWKITLS